MTVGIQQLMSRMSDRADAFHHALHVDRDVAGALAVLRDDATIVNLPAGTGATGTGLERYLVEEVVLHLPADLIFRRVSRTVDQRRLVDETTVAFTHDRPMPWLLPGLAPTGRAAQVLAISVLTFAHTSRFGVVESHIVSHRTLWDHADLLAQLGAAAVLR